MYGINLLLHKWLLTPFLSVIRRSLTNTGWTPYNISSSYIRPAVYFSFTACGRSQWSSRRRFTSIRQLCLWKYQYFLQYLFCIGKYRLDCRVNLFWQPPVLCDASYGRISHVFLQLDTFPFQLNRKLRLIMKHEATWAVILIIQNQFVLP